MLMKSLLQILVSGANHVIRGDFTFLSCFVCQSLLLVKILWLDLPFRKVLEEVHILLFHLVITACDDDMQIKFCKGFFFVDCISKLPIRICDIFFRFENKQKISYYLKL